MYLNYIYDSCFHFALYALIFYFFGVNWKKSEQETRVYFFFYFIYKIYKW